MSNDAHTPTPRQVKHEDYDPFEVIANIDGPDDGRFHYDSICDCDQDSKNRIDCDESKANAAFIVKACNSHDTLTTLVGEMKTALELALRNEESRLYMLPASDDYKVSAQKDILSAAIGNYRAALTKAREAGIE